jgi:ubiquinone biosynthesis protein COQ4
MEAAKAVRYFLLLLANPDQQTRFGTLFVLASEGDTFERSLSGFAATEAGARLLEERPDMLAILRDRAALRRNPSGSVGSRYAEFIGDHDLDETYYQSQAVAAAEREGRDVRHAWYRVRNGTLHDMMHLISGYGADALGEACLLSFRSAQTGHRGLLALVAMLSIRSLLREGRSGLRAVREAYQRGRTSGRLEWMAWEEAMAIPLSNVRATLGLAPPCLYPRPVAADAYEGLRAASSVPVRSAAGAQRPATAAGRA